MEGGTLYQLRNLINRRNVVSDPSKDVNACEDFFVLVVTAHILVAAMDILGMNAMNDIPDETLIPPTTTSKEEKAAVIQSVGKVLIQEYVDLQSTMEKPAGPQTKSTSHVHTSEPAQKHAKKRHNHDYIQEYAKEVLTMGLFYFEFQDAIREGDGERVLRCWKYLFLFFRVSGHTNYTNEAFILLSQYYYLLPPRLAGQLIWSRFVNTHGFPGRNIPADLFMEHLNRLCKDAVRHLGANKTPNAIVRTGKIVQSLSDALDHFDHENGVDHGSGAHTRQSEAGDLIKIVSEIRTKSAVFANIPGRKHMSFPSIKCNMFTSINQTKFWEWMETHFAKLLARSTLNC